MIKMTEENKGKRLDLFLVELYPEKSRSKLQAFIKNGSVLINKKTTTPHYSLKEGDELDVNLKKKIKKEKVEKIVMSAIKPEIIEENEEFIVINKPSGIIVHGGVQIKEKTLVDFLIKKYPEIKNIGEDAYRPGIVHRLDKEVSGLMVVARTQESFLSLKKQFQKRQVIKEYTALTFGKISKNEDEVSFRIDRAASGFKMAAMPLTVKGEENTAGRDALTRFEVMKRYFHFTLVRVNILTGRTHQIRAHFSAYGHPLVGDDLYGTKKTRILNKKYNLGRVFLVSNSLSFKTLKKEKKEYNIELPKELKNFLEKIK